MADRYLLESGAPDGYQKEDASGVLLLETNGFPAEDKNPNNQHRTVYPNEEYHKPRNVLGAMALLLTLNTPYFSVTTQDVSHHSAESGIALHTDKVLDVYQPRNPNVRNALLPNYISVTVDVSHKSAESKIQIHTDKVDTWDYRRTAPLIVVLTPARQDVATGRTTDFVANIKPVSGRNTSNLITVLTSYGAAYDPATDVLQRRDTRSEYLDPPFQFAPQQTAELVTVLTVGYENAAFIPQGSVSPVPVNKPIASGQNPKNLITVLTSYSVAYNSATDILHRRDMRSEYIDPVQLFAPEWTASALTIINTYDPATYNKVLRGRDTSVWPTPEFITAQQPEPRVVTDAYYKPELDLVLENRQAKDVVPLEYGPARSMSPIIRDAYYQSARDIVLLNKQSKVLVKDADIYPAMWPTTILDPVQYPYVPARDIVLPDHRSKVVDADFVHIQPRNFPVTEAVFYPYVPALDLGKLVDHRSKDVDPAFVYDKPWKANLVGNLVQYGVYDASADWLLKDRRSKDVYPLESGPARSVALLTVLTAYDPAVYNKVLKGRDTSVWPTPEFITSQGDYPRVTTDFYYHPEYDIVLRDRRNKDVDATFVHLQPQKAELVRNLTSYYVGFVQDKPLQQPQDTTVFPIADHIVQRVMNPLIRDSFFKPQFEVFPDRRAKDAIPAPEYGPSWKADLIKTLTTYVIYVPANDIVLKNRNDKTVDPAFVDLSTRVFPVTRGVFYPYVPARDIVLLNRQSKFEFFGEPGPARKINLLSIDRYPLASIAADIVLLNKQHKVVYPDFEYLKWAKADRRVTDAFFVPGVHIFLKDRRNKEVDPTFVYLKTQIASMISLVVPPVIGTVVVTLDDDVLTALGSVITGISGTVNVTLESDTLQAYGSSAGGNTEKNSVGSVDIALADITVNIDNSFTIEVTLVNSDSVIEGQLNSDNPTDTA